MIIISIFIRQYKLIKMDKSKQYFIDKIYDKTKNNYSDITHLTTVKSLTTRLSMIRLAVNNIPENRRTRLNKKFKKLYIESRLIRYKLALYIENNKELPSHIHYMRKVLELTDRNENINQLSDRENNKKLQNITLLQFIFARATDKEMKEFYDTLKGKKEKDVKQ